MFQYIFDKLDYLVRKSNNDFKACGYEKLTLSGTAQALASIPDNAKYALLELESADTGIAARFLNLGTKTLPTTAEGIGRSNLDAWDITDYANIANFRAIRVQSGATILYVQYYC